MLSTKAQERIRGYWSRSWRHAQTAVSKKANVLGTAEAVRGRAKLHLAETDTGAWRLCDVHGGDGLEGAFLLTDDFEGACPEVTRSVPMPDEIAANRVVPTSPRRPP